MENNNVHVIPTMSSDDRAALSGEQESLLNSAPFPLESIDPPTEQDLQNVVNEHYDISSQIIENEQSSEQRLFVIIK